MKHVVYWDSDAFLRLLNRENDRTFKQNPQQAALDLKGCEDVWSLCQKGLTHIVTSTLTVAEVIHKNGTPKLNPENRVEVNNFFRNSFISLKPLTREIAELARDVVWDSNILAKDAVHVATCAYFKVREFHSFDGNLVGKNKIDVNGFSIRTSHPSPSQMEIVNDRN